MELGSEVRAYPVQILLWHELVNDQLSVLSAPPRWCSGGRLRVAPGCDLLKRTGSIGAGRGTDCDIPV